MTIQQKCQTSYPQAFWDDILCHQGASKQQQVSMEWHHQILKKHENWNGDIIVLAADLEPDQQHPDPLFASYVLVFYNLKIYYD